MSPVRPTRSPEEIERETKLVRQCQQGDMAAFEAIYAQHHRGLYIYLLSILRSTHAAEDLTQDVFVKLFHQVGSYRFQSPFAHWLFRMARNAAIDQLRRDKVRRAQSLDDSVSDNDSTPLSERLASGEKDPGQHSETERQAVIVRKAVLELPENFRQVVIMREWDDLAYEEIAVRLDLSVGTVKSRLFRARALLETALRDNL